MKKESPFTEETQNGPSKREEKKLEKKLEDKYGLGYKLLKKYGYKLGSGLGKEEQGISDPIEIIKRKSRTGISTNEEYENINKDDKSTNYILGKKRIK